MLEVSLYGRCSVKNRIYKFFEQIVPNLIFAEFYAIMTLSKNKGGPHMAKKAPIFQWDEESGTAVCIISDGDNLFIGTAECHEEDQDMKSEKTGSTIALFRATIKYYNHIKKNVLQPQLKQLNQLYYTMNRSKRFNPKSYENIMLQRQIQQREADLEMINELLRSKREDLRIYLTEKEKFYKRIRASRAAAAEQGK